MSNLPIGSLRSAGSIATQFGTGKISNPGNLKNLPDLALSPGAYLRYLVTHMESNPVYVAGQLMPVTLRGTGIFESAKPYGRGDWRFVNGALSNFPDKMSVYHKLDNGEIVFTCYCEQDVPQQATPDLYYVVFTSSGDQVTFRFQDFAPNSQPSGPTSAPVSLIAGTFCGTTQARGGGTLFFRPYPDVQNTP